MKRDRVATIDEIKESLEKDTLGRNLYLSNLLGMLPTIKKYTVFALDGSWGSGKTFFIKQLEYASRNPNNYINLNKNVIESFNREYSIFYFNAWENDFLPPLESVLVSLSNGIWDGRDKLASRAVGITKEIVNIPINYISGGAANLEKFKKTYLTDYIKHAKKLLNISEEISNMIHNYKDKTGRKLLFIIDDLDRCKPTFAVELLEVIKHNFNCDEAVFLICANNDQLQHTIKKYYGEGFDGYEYLDRFYDIVINLPDPDVGQYVKYCLDLRHPDYVYADVAIDIAKVEKFSLRQINRYISSLALLEDFLGGNSLSFDGEYGICVKNVFIQIALALKIIDHKKFNDFVSGSGEYIVEEYIKKSEEIRLVDERARNISESSLSVYYKALFCQTMVRHAPADAFRKAVTSVGFSSVVDEPYEATIFKKTKDTNDEA